MKMTVLMVTIYGGCAAAAATRLAQHGLLDSRVVLIALAATCLAHVCWRVIARKLRRNPAPRCLACQTGLGLFHRLAHHRFCSEQHEQVYLTELEEIALSRLQGARITVSFDSRVESALQRSEEAKAEGRQLVKFQAADIVA